MEKNENKTLIEKAEAFLNSFEAGYLYNSSKGILRGEIKLAQEGKPNELATYLEQFQRNALKRRESLFENEKIKEERSYEQYVIWKGNMTEPEIRMELAKYREKFDLSSAKEVTIPIGEHTQRKYRLQNITNSYMKMINFIENGLRIDQMKGLTAVKPSKLKQLKLIKKDGDWIYHVQDLEDFPRLDDLIDYPDFVRDEFKHLTPSNYCAELSKKQSEALMISAQDLIEHLKDELNERPRDSDHIIKQLIAKLENAQINCTKLQKQNCMKK